MLESLLFACIFLAVAGVLSRVLVGRWLGEGKERMNDAQLGAQHAAIQRRQNEDLLAFEEDRVRRLKAEHQTLGKQIENLKKRSGGSAPG